MGNRLVRNQHLFFLILFLAIAAGTMTGSFDADRALAQNDQDKAAAPAPGTSQTEVEVETLSPEQLEALQTHLADLKEKIFKSKASLKQLLDQIRMGSVSLVSFSILHTHEVGATFQLETLSYTLDGFQIYTAVNSPETDLEKLKDFPVYEGSLLPGEHLLTVDMIFRGKGYGIFSYLNQYLFKVKSRYTFTVAEGDVMTLHVTSFDEGSFLTSLKDRLKVRFEKD